MRLREHVANRRAYRAAEVGRAFFARSYDPGAHRAHFARFLEAVTAGGVAPSRELAQKFRAVLHGEGLERDSVFLASFLKDEPEWRVRLEGWIAKTLRDVASKAPRRRT